MQTLLLSGDFSWLKWNKADRHKSRAHTKEETHIQTSNWLTHMQICILAHSHTCTFAHLLIYTLAHLHTCTFAY